MHVFSNLEGRFSKTAQKTKDGESSRKNVLCSFSAGCHGQVWEVTSCAAQCILGYTSRCKSDATGFPRPSNFAHTPEEKREWSLEPALVLCRVFPTSLVRRFDFGLSLGRSKKLGLPSSRQIALRLLWACKKKFVRISSDPKVGTVQKVLAVGKHRSLRCAYPSISSRSMNLFSKEECLNLHKSQLSECHWRAFAKILGTGTLQAPGTITYDPSISILVGRIYKRGLAHSHVEKQQQSSIDKNIRRPI